HRIIDRRQIVHRQVLVRQQSKQNCRDRQHRGHHRPANKRLGEIPHDLASATCGGATLTGAFGTTISWPVVITLSPAFKPFSISIKSPCICPWTIGRISATSIFFSSSCLTT